MIEVTRINGDIIIVDGEAIEIIETATYDTIITLQSGKVISVKETPDEIRQKVIEYRRKLI